MVLRASALLRLVAPSHEASRRSERSDLLIITLSVLTRNSTASRSDAWSFARQKSSGLALPLHQHGLSLLSEPRAQRLNAARQHRGIEARVAHDAVADPGTHTRGTHDDEGLVADLLIGPGRPAWR